MLCKWLQHIQTCATLNVTPLRLHEPHSVFQTTVFHKPKKIHDVPGFDVVCNWKYDEPNQKHWVAHANINNV